MYNLMKIKVNKLKYNIQYLLLVKIRLSMLLKGQQFKIIKKIIKKI